MAGGCHRDAWSILFSPMSSIEQESCLSFNINKINVEVKAFLYDENSKKHVLTLNFDGTIAKWTKAAVTIQPGKYGRDHMPSYVYFYFVIASLQERLSVNHIQCCKIIIFQLKTCCFVTSYYMHLQALLLKLIVPRMTLLHLLRTLKSPVAIVDIEVRTISKYYSYLHNLVWQKK